MLYENLIIENRVAFLSKLADISARLAIPAEWLMIVFKIESAVNHRAVNPQSGATGLIQFMPATAAQLGTSTAALRNMSNVDQLEFVYKYFAPYRGRLNSITDLYTVTFFPRALGKADNYILQTDTIAAGTIAAQNRPYDINRDNAITYGELKAAIMKKIPAEAQAAVKKKLFGLA